MNREKTSVPVPTLEIPLQQRVYKRRNQRDTSKLYDSSVALDLTFLPLRSRRRPTERSAPGGRELILQPRSAETL